eukprot:15444884-Alexandrium_andersonii.AAC.1
MSENVVQLGAIRCGSRAAMANSPHGQGWTFHTVPMRPSQRHLQPRAALWAKMLSHIQRCAEPRSGALSRAARVISPRVLSFLQLRLRRTHFPARWASD